MTRLSLIASTLLLCCTSQEPTPCAQAMPCVSAPPQYVCLDTELPDAARQGIRDWGSVLCNKRRFAMRLIDGSTPIPEDCSYTILAVLSTYSWVQTGAAGFADIDRHIAWIVVDRVPSEMWRAVMAHEFGHLLGAKTDGSGIMADPLQDSCITKQNILDLEH